MCISLIYIAIKSKYFVLQDIDECAENNGGCSHICTNEPGSRQCTCREGFALDSDGQSCFGRNMYPFYSGLNYNNEVC